MKNLTNLLPMFAYKKIFSPRHFLPTISSSTLAWPIVLIDFITLVISVAVASLAFGGGLQSFLQIRGSIPFPWVISIIVIGLLALTRIVIIRLVIACGVAYLLQQGFPVFKQAGITFWRMVNTYFYAFFIILLVQLGFEVLILLIPESLLQHLGSYRTIIIFMRWFVRVFELAVAGLWGYWMYREIQKMRWEAKGIVQDNAAEEVMNNSQKDLKSENP